MKVFSLENDHTIKVPAVLSPPDGLTMEEEETAPDTNGEENKETLKC